MFPILEWLYTTKKKKYTNFDHKRHILEGGERDSRLWLEDGAARLHEGGSWNSLKRGEDLGLLLLSYSCPIFHLYFFVKKKWLFSNYLAL